MSLRKLQGEIEKTIKKVNEGLAEFHAIWAKFESAQTFVLKEKYEGDLKKEIKKLQRLRDQIKVWQTLDEIKDKQSLFETRKAIEVQMERFKVLEKEMKIKAFSKEGLSQSAKLSPQEKEKNELAQWLRDSVESLNSQIESYEAELELLEAGNKKGSKSAEQPRIETLNKHIDQHKYHIEKLEVCLRLLENDQIENEKISLIKDSVVYYISSHQEDNFMEDDELYTDIESSALPYSLKVDLADEEPPSPSSSLPGVAVERIKAAVVKIEPPKVVAAKPPEKASTPVVETALPPTAVKPAAVPSPKLQPTQSFVSAATSSLSAENAEKSHGTNRSSPFAQVTDYISGKSDAIRSCDEPFAANFLDIVSQTAAMDADFSSHFVVSPLSTASELRPDFFNRPSFFECLDLDTLFYIFYYLPNTSLQYLASLELKRQSWRFHRKYMTWFQRFEEPTVITNEFEQGTYVYFDYEGSWCQRKKSNFVFEYKDLEDDF